MERNFVRASEARAPLARKIIATIIGAIGISLLAFAGPMQKVVDSSLRTNPLGSGAHLAIENQKGLTNEPLPLGISVVDASGGETVIIAELAEGTELSLGTAMGSGIWLVPVADLDNTFVGAPRSFVGVMTAKVTLNTASGQRLDARNIRFDWSKPEFSSPPPPEETEQTRGSVPPSPARTEPMQSPTVSETAESSAASLRSNPATAPAANCLRSAAEVRALAPKAWPKWTYGPRGQRCWYSGRKPAFPKEVPDQVKMIPAPPTEAPIDTPSPAGSDTTQSPPCLASAAEVRKLTPKAWPKWTYGPYGKRCWYSGDKPVFAKAR